MLFHLILVTILEGEACRYDACFIDAKTLPAKRHERGMREACGRMPVISLASYACITEDKLIVIDATYLT